MGDGKGNVVVDETVGLYTLISIVEAEALEMCLSTTRCGGVGRSVV